MSASKFTPEKAHAFLCVLADTCNVTKAAAAISVSRHTVYDWRDADPEFAKKWERAALLGAYAVEDTMIERATQGWDEPLSFQGELTGKNGGPIQCSDAEAAKELADLMAALEARDVSDLA
jgi:hypothetical protein